MEMTIGEVARRSGMSPSAIRYYERLGVLPQPDRTGGRRRYDAAVLEALAIIRFAKHLGFGLAETRVLLSEHDHRPRPERWRESAERRLAEIDALVADAQRMRGLLEETLRHKCPKLAERGDALLVAETPGSIAERQSVK
jgi:MerR family transcriptional regulator, redox-sensitive transcriptional activator SoxR